MSHLNPFTSTLASEICGPASGWKTYEVPSVHDAVLDRVRAIDHELELDLLLLGLDARAPGLGRGLVGGLVVLGLLVVLLRLCLET